MSIKPTAEQILEVKNKYVFPSFYSIANPKYEWSEPEVEGIIKGQDIYPKDEELILAAFKADPIRYFTSRDLDDKNQIELDDASAYTIAESFAAEEEMARLSNAIDAAISKATAFADKYNLNFHMDTAYGMGGYYDGEDGEWHPSSQSC